MKLWTILQCLQGRRVRGGGTEDYHFTTFSQFKTTSQLLLCSSKKEGVKGTVSLPHSLLLPSPRSRTQLDRSEDRSIPHCCFCSSSMQRSSSTPWPMQPARPPATKTVQGALSFLPFLKLSLEQPDWSSFTICKARRNIRPHSLASCPAQPEPAWTEAVLRRTAVADGLSIYGSFPTKRCPRARQDCRTREIRGSKESCATHTSHGTATLHKAGETIGTQHKKPEQLSAA